jgi:protein TonB
LLGYDQIPAQTPKRAIELVPPRPRPSPPEPAKAPKKDEQKTEAALFAYMDGERAEQPSPSRFHLGKKAIFGAAFLAIIAIAATPQAPWHPQLRTLWQTGQKTVRGWLNPQPVTAVQEAPRAHEELYRPGDEYKLPVAENIPDATTDPSQIEVVPAVDPTAKKPTLDAANPAPTSAAPDTSPTDQPSTQTVPAPEVQPTQLTSTQVTPAPPQPVAVTTAVPASQPKTVTAVSLPPQPTALPVASPAQPKPAAPQPHYVSPTGTVPQSLRSQLAPATPDPVSKPADTGLPSIEPVTVTEAAERALVTDQPTIPYPANAKNQQGTVVLQVLIARDGTVQDAKFLQGSFLFARTAIDGVKQWKFKPYILNGRPVSVQTTMTMKFKPGQ